MTDSVTRSDSPGGSISGNPLDGNEVETSPLVVAVHVADVDVKGLEEQVTWIDEVDHVKTENQISTDSDHGGSSEKQITVVMDEDSAGEESTPAKIEVEIEQAPERVNDFHADVKPSDSASTTQLQIHVIEEEPSQTAHEEHEPNDDQQEGELQLTEEDQEKLLDIYEDLFKGAAQSEEEERVNQTPPEGEDKETTERPRRCRCDCDTLLRAVECNFKVIRSKFCICGRRRRRLQRRRQQQQQAAQRVTTSATNPVVVEQQPAAGVSVNQPPSAEEEGHENEKALEIHDFMTPTTQRARKQGWSYYSKFAFPLVNDVVRDFWVFGELSLLLLSFILSLVFFALDSNNRKGFNIFHLILTIIASILALIDAIFQLKDCKSCKAAINYRKRMKASREETDEYELDHTANKDANKKGCDSDSEASSQIDAGEAGTTTKCQARVEKLKDTMDIIRTLASEAIFYPLLMCDLFEFITGRGWMVSDATDRLSLVLFLLSCTGIFLYVYLARIMVLCSVVINVHKKRKAMRQNKNDPTGLYIQVYFAIHVCLQMVAQIFMIIAIAAKIRYENRGYDPDSPVCESAIPSEDIVICSPSASSRLWYMFISAYILPICGLLTFYIVCYYWVTELPLTVCLDFLRLLEAGSCDSFLSPKKSAEDKVKKGKNLLKRYHNSVCREFEKIYNVKFINKLLFPFKNPVVIVLCITYAAFQFAFVACAGFSGVVTGESINKATNTVILNEGLGWTIFFFIAAALGALANIYTFFIAYFWLIIITIVLTLILLYILCVLCELCTIVDDCMKCRDIPTPGRIRGAFGV